MMRGGGDGVREGRIGGGADRGDAGGEGGGDSELSGRIWRKREGEGECCEVDARGREVWMPLCACIKRWAVMGTCVRSCISPVYFLAINFP